MGENHEYALSHPQLYGFVRSRVVLFLLDACLGQLAYWYVFFTLWRDV